MESQPWKLCHWEVFETDNIQNAKQKIFFFRILTSSSSLIDDRAAIADAIPAFLAWTRDWTTHDKYKVKTTHNQAHCKTLLQQ